ncbi:MAG: hemolysin family protein [Proteobacteria bacterium]|nr:hemolysin family protein [Pseudomonadota bacterium]
MPISRPSGGWWRRLFPHPNGADLRDAIGGLIDKQEEAGEMPATRDELVLLRNILNLHGLTVHDVMVQRADIVSVDIDVSLPDLVRLMSEQAHSRIPVYRGTLDDIEGMVHIKDVLACSNLEHPLQPKDIIRRVLFVAPSMPILELLLQMRVTRVHMALVVDEFGGIDGLVTIEDLVEEIVGEIEDEHDEDGTPLIAERSDGSFDADSRVPLEEFEERVGQVLTDEERTEDIDTLGGLIFFLAGRVPVRGEVIRHESGVEFEILDADPRRIRRMRVSRKPHSGDAAG